MEKIKTKIRKNMRKINLQEEGEIFKVLKLEKDYPTYQDFYDHEQHHIYRSVMDVFSGFRYTEKEELILKVYAKIDGIDWDTQFNFKRSDVNVLERDLIPYFELNEDYEMCNKIKNLKKELMF